MPGKIFVSYRRDDVAGDARGMRDALAARFGRANVFMDVDNLLAGQRFDKALSEALDACDVLIAVIGPRWRDLLKERTQSGERDYVREEIAAALQRGIVVIPVRVGVEGRMPPLPRGGDLPEDIRDLVLHQKHDVTHERFGRDVADLILAIDAAHERRDRDKAKLHATMEVVAPVQSLQDYTRPQVDYDDTYHDDEEGLRRSPSWTIIAAAMVGAVGIGGVMAYTYKAIVTPNSVRVPVVRADTEIRASPEHRGGKETAKSDKKFLSRLDEDPSEDKVGPQSVQGAVPPAAQPPSSSVPGIMLTMVPPRAQPAPFKVAPPPQQTANVGQPPPSPPAVTSGAGFVAVLSSQKSRMDALKVFSDLQQKYGEALSGRTPDVHEVDLSARGLGTAYRLVVGPPGSRDAANGVCSQLKTAGYRDCWVMAY